MNGPVSSSRRVRNSSTCASSSHAISLTWDFDRLVMPMDLAVPKLRQGSCFPEWLLERRKRAERTLTSVVATCYLLGVSTRRMDKLVQSPGSSARSRRVPARVSNSRGR